MTKNPIQPSSDVMRKYEEIEKRCKREENAYKKFRNAFMSEVIRWEYYQEPAWHWYPNTPVANKPAKKQKAAYRYGYDRAGRVIVMIWDLPIIQVHVKPGQMEEFLRYSEEKIEVSKFSERRLQMVQTATLKNGRVVEAASTGWGDTDVEVFTWVGQRATKRVTHLRTQEDAVEAHYDLKTKEFEDKFRIKPDGTRRPIGLPTGVTVNSVAEKIRKRFVKGVYELVAKAKITEPIYCVVLAYSGEGNPVFPPSIGIGLESERQKWLKKDGKEARHIMWNPENFLHNGKPYLEIQDEAYDIACDWYSEAMMERSSDAPALKLINDIAAALAKLNWSRVARITDDFVVLAVDLEGDDLQKNMKKSVPAAVLQKLKSGGFV